MKETKQLGKITSFRVGNGEGRIGIEVSFSGPWGGVSAPTVGAWSGERSPHASWSEADRIRILGETMLWLDGILTEAKKRTTEEMVGVPVEIIFDGDYGSPRLVSWRVLTEVL